MVVFIGGQDIVSVFRACVVVVTVVDSLDAVHSSGLSVVSVVRACVVASYSSGFIGLSSQKWIQFRWCSLENVLLLVAAVGLLDFVQIRFLVQGWPDVGPRWDMRPRGKRLASPKSRKVIAQD